MSYGLACFQQAPRGVHHASCVLQAPRQQRIASYAAYGNNVGRVRNIQGEVHGAQRHTVLQDAIGSMTDLALMGSAETVAWVQRNRLLLLQRWRCLVAPSFLNQIQTHEFVSLRMGLEVWAVRKHSGCADVPRAAARSHSHYGKPLLAALILSALPLQQSNALAVACAWAAAVHLSGLCGPEGVAQLLYHPQHEVRTPVRTSEDIRGHQQDEGGL